MIDERDKLIWALAERLSKLEKDVRELKMELAVERRMNDERITQLESKQPPATYGRAGELL